MRFLVFLLFSILMFSCVKKQQQKYPSMIGDIVYDKALDGETFKLCNQRAVQYFNVEGEKYLNEKTAINELFFSKFKNIDVEQSGLIRIRFIVNCEGKAGFFRVIQMDESYQEVTFDKRITSQLLQITKSIDSWLIKYYKETPIDYYQYLIFKIENGKLIEIMP